MGTSEFGRDPKIKGGIQEMSTEELSLEEPEEEISFSRITSRDKKLLAIVITAVLPLLILIYLFIDLLTPGLDQGASNREFVNVGLIVLLTMLLSTLGVVFLYYRDKY